MSVAFYDLFLCKMSGVNQSDILFCSGDWKLISTKRSVLDVLFDFQRIWLDNSVNNFPKRGQGSKVIIRGVKESKLGLR